MGMGSVTDRAFSHSKVPLVSWVTLGRQIDVKPASDRMKPKPIASAVAELIWRIFFPSANGARINEK